MKLELNLLNKRREAGERRTPSHLFGGRVRTSTIVLVVVFLALWWTYETYRPHEQAPSPAPSSQVVPPGYVPDPGYTWVPRTRVEQPQRTQTPTPTPTTTTPPPPPTTTTTTTTPLIQLPCIPPFCTPTSTPSPSPSPPPPSGPVPLAPGR